MSKRSHPSHYGPKPPTITTADSGDGWRIDRVYVPYVGSDYAVYVGDNYIGSYPTIDEARTARQAQTYELLSRKAA